MSNVFFVSCIFFELMFVVGRMIKRAACLVSMKYRQRRMKPQQTPPTLSFNNETVEEQYNNITTYEMNLSRARNLLFSLQYLDHALYFPTVNQCLISATFNFDFALLNIFP